MCGFWWFLQKPDPWTHGPRDQWTDGPTNQWMDMPSPRDAKTHLKTRAKNLKRTKQGRIHDIRCIPILHYAIFSDFYKSVTDRRPNRLTDGPTDRRTDTPSYRDARTHLKRAIWSLKHHQNALFFDSSPRGISFWPCSILGSYLEYKLFINHLIR